MTIAKIRKAVFPVAGFGTRFLPATKANPKEMLPIVDKPLIQYAVEEAVSIGVTQLIFVTSQSKRAIEDHFDSNFELETKLQEQGKQELLQMVQNILPKGVSCVYVRQQEQLGLGHAVLCAKDIVDKEPFAVLLADDLIDGGNKNCLQQMAAIYNKTGDSVLAVQEVPMDEVEKYGVVELHKHKWKKEQVKSLVEKPPQAEAPSNLAIVGRYILHADVFAQIEKINKGAVGEMQLTDGISGLLKRHKVRICKFKGKRYDCGNKIGYVEATIEYALKHPETREYITNYLNDTKYQISRLQST